MMTSSLNIRCILILYQVVLERESIRTLCDKLRRERDRAVSELAEALRDSDDVKKQGNECAKENKDLRYEFYSIYALMFP